MTESAIGTPPKEEMGPLPATRRLLETGGPFDFYPGPALLLGPDGQRLAGNGPAQALLPHLGVKSLAEALDLARQGRPVTLVSVEIPSLDGADQILDLVVLACGDGQLIIGRDVGLERALRGALIESRQRFKALIDVAGDFTWETDAAGRFAFVSVGGALGYAAADLVGTAPDRLVLPDQTAELFLAGAKPQGGEVWIRLPDGASACLLVQGQSLLGPDGGFKGARGLARDITAEKARAAELAEARHRERLVVHLLKSLRRAVEPKSALMTALGIAEQALGASSGDVVQLDPDGAIVKSLSGIPGAKEGDQDRALVKAALLAGGKAVVDSPTHHGLCLLCRLDGTINGALLLWRWRDRGPWGEDDLFLLLELAEQLSVLIEQLKGQEVLSRLSTTDPLTGLLNRRGFEAALERAILRARADRRTGALFYVDLDNFKEINDRYGHAQGDAALIAAAGILRRNLRAADLVGRLGGDEFVLWLDDIPPEEAAVKARDLLADATQLRKFAPDALRPVGFSIGVAMLKGGVGHDITALMVRADEAMYRVKRDGKGSFTVVAA